MSGRGGWGSIQYQDKDIIVISCRTFWLKGCKKRIEFKQLQNIRGVYDPLLNCVVIFVNMASTL